MIRMTVAKWIAAGALALAVPAIGLAGHTTDVIATTAMASVDAVKSLSTGSTTTTKTTHHKKKLHSKSHTKRKSLHSHHKKHKNLKATKPAAS